MGYLCPVCEEPFADSKQCTNHLAVTAILHGDDHERWLTETLEEAADESLDSWESIPRDELAALVTDHAVEIPDHDHSGEHTASLEPTTSSPLERAAFTEPPAALEGLDADSQAILRQARELTQKMAQHGADESEES